MITHSPQTAAEFIRSTLTGPKSSCSVDLQGLGDMFTESTTAIYLLIDAESSASWTMTTRLHHDERVRLVHAISRWAGGEVRGYVWHGDSLYLRRPANPEDWPELDALVEQATGARVKAVSS